VRESHYALTDIPMTFFVTLTVLATLRAYEQRHAGAFAIAGVAAGLAIGIKYNAGLVLVAPLLAAWMTHPVRPSRLVAALATIAAAVVTFFIVSPYTILDLPGFLNGFARLMTSYVPRDAGVLDGALIYYKHLRNAFGWPSMMLLAAGVVLGVVRVVNGPGRVRWAVLLVFCGLFFWAIAGRHLIYGRYLLPIVPFACVFVAVAVISGVSLLRRFNIQRAVRKALIVGLTVMALLPPALGSTGFVRMISRTWTQSLAFAWIEAHVPPGSHVVIERADLVLPAAHYRADHVRFLTERSLEQYREAGVDYLIASSQAFGPALENPQQHRDLYHAYMRLFTEGREVARFTPASDRPGPELRVIEVGK
jgi:4-amino-4-deoxy-L-arabinose transferase-like glycosyltransferase